MLYNRLKRTNLRVSELCLGTMTFGGQVCEKESFAIMDCANDNGINFWDTANSYNCGESERIVGQALKGRRDSIILATKVCNPTGNGINDHGLSRRQIFAAVDESLRRLATDYIDIYYLHAPDYETHIDETMDAMNDLIHIGKIRYIGVSNIPAWLIADILAICDKRGYVAPVITQNVYNTITRGIEDELVPFIKAHDLSLAVFNPLAGGLLTGKHNPDKPAKNTRFFNNPGYCSRYWLQENFAAVDKMKETAQRHDMSLTQMSLKWCISRPHVTSVITGASHLDQLKENLSFVDGNPLPDEILKTCDEVWDSLCGSRFSYHR